jgi:hypothetical protein
VRTGSTGAEPRALRLARAAALGGALAGAACAARATPRDVPAILDSPTAASRAELRRVVSEALHGAPVTLADDALTADGTLLVERAAHRDASGRPVTGRDPGRPERFRLVKDGERCVLVHEASGRRFELESATCSPR